jgi:hypothetical protein
VKEVNRHFGVDEIQKSGKELVVINIDVVCRQQ